MNFIEKRIFRRLKTEIPVELELKKRTLKASTSNISCGGMFLKVNPKELTQQHQVHLAIHLPSQKTPVKLVGEVRRSEKGGVAFEFQGLYNDNILAIERYVKSNLN